MNALTTDKKYICVEGLIGSGKTMLCKELAKHEEVFGPRPLIQFEPAEGENPYLEAYYSDPKANAFKMQVFLLSRRYRAHLAAQSLALAGTCSVIADRSYFGDRCFAEVQHADGYFSDADFSTYLALHKDMQRNILYPSAFVYLKTPVSLAMERVSRRMSEIAGRKCECAISIDYMTALDRQIARMMEAMKKYCPVLEFSPLDAFGEEIPVEKLAYSISCAIKYVIPRYDSWQGVQ